MNSKPKALHGIIEFVHFMQMKYNGFMVGALIMVVVLIVFESLQQYYYVLQFNLAPKDQISLIELALAHTYRWAVWLILNLIYFGTIIYNGKSDRVFNITKITPAIQHLIILILLNVTIISLLQILFNNRDLTFQNYWENCVFYFFQKVPIYVLAQGAMLGIFHLVNSNQNLEVEVLDLKNQPAGHGLQALSIKIGNKNKIIPLSDIVWIEAYDYCVKIHTVNQHAYAMRNSLKALEKKLKNQQFLRVHRKAIVNMNKISEITFNSTSYLTLTNQVKVDISQSRMSEVKNFLKTAG